MAGGYESPRSNEAMVAVPPLAAPVLSVPIEMSEPGGLAFALAWTSPDPEAPALQYNVYRATTPGGEGATPYAAGVTGNIAEPLSMPFGSSYYYEVSAVVGGVESPRSNEVHVAAPFPGTTVRDIHATGFPITATVGQAVTVPVAEFDAQTVRTPLKVEALQLSKAQKAKPVSLSISTPIRRFVARIRWGDGKISRGDVTGSNGRITVYGTHTYLKPGSLRARVVILNRLTRKAITLKDPVTVLP